MLSLQERADLLVQVAELHRTSAFEEIRNLLGQRADEELFSELDLGYSLALAYYRTGEFDAARRLNRLLIGRARANAIGRLYRKHLILEGVLHVEIGNLHEAEALFHEAMAYATRAADQWIIADVMMNLGVLALIAERWRTALTSFERALTAYSILGRPYSIAACHQNLGMTYRGLAMVAESESHFENAYHLFASAVADRSYELSLVESERALLVSKFGDQDRAEAMARRALARVSGLGIAEREAEALRVLGVVLGSRGQLDEAIACLEEALRLARRNGRRLLEAEVCEALCVVNGYGGLAESAKRFASDAIRIYGALGSEARVRSVLERAATLSNC